MVISLSVDLSVVEHNMTLCMFKLKLVNCLIALIGEIILEKNICYSFCYTSRVVRGNFILDPVVHVALDFKPYCCVELSQEEKAFYNYTNKTGYHG